MQIELTKDQVTGIVKLIDAEIAANIARHDDAYNTYWNNIKESLGQS